MLRQRAAVAEALATLCALRWPFSQVRLAVERKLRGDAEGLAALGTFVWLVAGMVAPMNVEIGHAREPLTAQFATVGLLACVRAPVFGEV